MEDINKTMDTSAPATQKLIRHKLRKLSEKGIFSREEMEKKLDSKEEETDSVE